MGIEEPEIEERKEFERVPSIYNKDFQFMYLKARIREININYFNQKSIFYEPLIEPWDISLTLEQENPFVEKNI